MDLFQRAHVAKKETLRKESKSEEAVKNRLRQMLHGFKHNNTKLIKSCEDETKKFSDDSSSVSGYSDLNLTNSSNEIDVSNTTTDFVYSEEYVTDNENECSDSSTSQNSNVPRSLDDSRSNLKEFVAPTADNGSILNFSDQLSQIMALDSNSENSRDDSLLNSINSDFCHTSPMGISSDDSDFDANGELALKILQKLGQKKNVKPKLSIEHVKTTTSKKKAHKRKIPYFQENLPTNKTVTDSFITLKANNMPDQSLSEVLGCYKYSTAKKMPVLQNKYSADSAAFSFEEMNVVDIQIQEDSSIEHEIHDNDVTDIDESIGPVTDGLSVYDSTQQSEETTDKDLTDTLENDTNYTDSPDDKEMNTNSVEDMSESSVQIFYGHECSIFVLKYPTELYIHGKVKIKVLCGTIEISGYTLKNDTVDIYAPNYNLTQCVRTVVKPQSHEGWLNKLTAAGLSAPEAENIVSGIGENDAVIRLSKLYSYKMDFVENNMSSVDLFRKNMKHVENHLRKASIMLRCSLYLTRPWKALVEATGWKTAVQLGLVRRSRGIVCGGKGVGKSTFLRHCVNNLLSNGPVLVLDLDPGQSEFTVPGNISATIVDTPLIGPSFTHLKNPHIMLYIGMINTMDNPRRYATAVTDLITQCHNDSHLKSMPWVINTMGMCNNMGLKLITLAIVTSQPTYLLQIDSLNSKKNFGVSLDAHTVKELSNKFKYDPFFRNVTSSVGLDYSFIDINKPEDLSKNNFSLPPRDERYMKFLAYFGELLSTQQKHDILAVVPYAVKLEDLHIGFNVKVNDDSVTKVINGKVVALCQLTTQDNVRKVFTLKDKPLLCHGHGLIRGVDMETGIVYISTPTPVEKLHHVSALVYADWVSELRGQETHLPDGIKVPYRTSTIYEQRQLMIAPRRRFNPLQLLKMSRNS